MREGHDKTLACQKCGNNKSKSEMMPLELVAEPIAGFIKKKYPEILETGAVCLGCLDNIRGEYVRDILSEDSGELSSLQKDVVQSLKEQDLLARNTNAEFDKNLTLGQRVADKVAEFGGSWKFIFIFTGTLIFWIIINSVKLMDNPFDPYPFILLNLVLSCLAAIQAPIIMMSQNRQAEKDRMQADHDYRTNLKAELEIRQLNWKVDQLLLHHWQRLLEIQQVQTELMEELAQKKC